MLLCFCYGIVSNMEIPYLEYFGLTEKPFGMSPDPSFYFESAEHKQAIESLSFFIAQQEGFALIYGDVGSGKTMLSRIFLNTLDREKYNTALILNPVSDDSEFMKEVLHEYGASDIPETKKELYDRLRLYLLEEYEKGKVNVLIIDEAQLLSSELLEFIRLLSNIETDKQKILHTVFFAQPEFLDKLKDPAMRHLSQRITVTYCIRPLTYPEIKAYIGYRLFKAGAKGSLEFQDRAVKLIHTASRGYPRLINYICDRCLLVLYANSNRTVDAHVVSKVIIEESIPLGTAKYTEESKIMLRRPVLIGVVACAVIILGLAGYYFASTGFFSSLTQKRAPTVAVSVPNAETSLIEKAPVLIPPSASTSKPAVLPEPVAPESNKEPQKKVFVNTDIANVRARPDIESNRVGIIPRDDVLTVLGEKTGADNQKWYRIKLYEGREGWVSETIVRTK